MLLGVETDLQKHFHSIQIAIKADEKGGSAVDTSATDTVQPIHYKENALQDDHVDRQKKVDAVDSIELHTDWGDNVAFRTQ